MTKKNDLNECAEAIPLVERKFINYLKKWYLGARTEFIKKEIKRNSELEIDIGSDEISDERANGSYVNSFGDDWIEDIENKELYWLIKNLPDKRRDVVGSVIIRNQPLSDVAEKLHISKQLAHAYKAQFLEHARRILKSSRT